MAFWNIVGGTANTSFDSHGFATGTDIDQGSIRHAGNIAETTKFTNVSLGEGNPVITIGSTGTTYGIVDANSAGLFNQGDHVIVRVTNDIAGVSNTTLVGGDSNSAASPAINQAGEIEVKLYKTAIRNGDWNPTTAPWGGTPVSVAQSGAWNIESNVDNAATLVASGTDDAANPTQDVPGELVYNYGSGSDPTQDEYEAKTNW
jgi:hypothetical protein